MEQGPVGLVHPKMPLAAEVAVLFHLPAKVEGQKAPHTQARAPRALPCNGLKVLLNVQRHCSHRHLSKHPLTYFDDYFKGGVLLTYFPVQAVAFLPRELPANYALDLAHGVTKLAILFLITQSSHVLTWYFSFPYRTEFPQPRNNLRHQRQRELHIVCCVLLAQAEADAGARTIRRESHRRQNMRRFDCA